VEMRRIGVMQGNYLAIYVSNRCLYWAWKPSLACKFCTTGQNVGTTEESKKRVDDVVEVARAAQEESHSVFTHFNTGYHYEDRADREIIHGLRQGEPLQVDDVGSRARQRRKHAEMLDRFQRQPERRPLEQPGREPVVALVARVPGGSGDVTEAKA